MTAAPQQALADPSFDIDNFRRALGEFATGVTVITTEAGDVLYGVTSNSFASVSLTPPLVLWSIRRQSQSFAAFETCSHFAVNVLAHDQMELSQRFARSGPNKFDGVDWRPGRGSAPVLGNVAASFECRRTDVFDGGDHLVIMGHVEQFERHDCQPLLFTKGRYAVAAEHPEARLQGGSKDAPELEDRLVSPLLIQGYSAIASRLEQDRMASGLGLTLMQARLLKAAQTYPNSTLEALLPELLLDFNASQSVLDTVIALGLLVVDERHRVRLTPAGEARLGSVIDHAGANEAVLFKGVPPEDIATVQRVLRKLIAQQRPV